MYTHPKWKCCTVYNGIYFIWDKNTCTSQCRKWNSIMCRDVKRLPVGESVYKKKEKSIGSFWFKVMNSPYIYNTNGGNWRIWIFKVSNLTFALWFHKTFFIFSYDLSFSQMAAKRTFVPYYNQLSFWWTVCFHYMSYLPVMQDKWLLI